MSLPPIGVCIPAYRAAATLPAVLDRIEPDVRGGLAGIWIVNDGSPDGTGDTIETLARRDHLIHPVHFDRNRGYGHAVREGLSRCRDSGAAYAVCLHADGQYPPEKIGPFVHVMHRDRLDVLQGSRIRAGTALKGGMPLYKYVANRLLTFLENRVFGLRMSDYHSGFLCYSRKALETLPLERLSGSFDFDLEVIASARKAGLTVSELPIPTRYAEEVSYLSPVNYGMRCLGVMVRYLRGGYAV